MILSLPRFVLPRWLPVLVAALAGAPALAQTGPQLGLPRVELTAGMYRIDAQLARSPQERQIGLMFRQDMPAHEGMLFVFEQPATQCFWMKNTPLPLTAAFVADDGTIVNLADTGWRAAGRAGLRAGAGSGRAGVARQAATFCSAALSVLLGRITASSLARSGR